MPAEPVIHTRHKNDTDEDEIYEMHDSRVSSTLAPHDESAPVAASVSNKIARHTLGLLLLLCVVFLWTASNFLGSSIFADHTYAKPFFLTYLNTAVFVFCLIPGLWRSVHGQHGRGTWTQTIKTTLTRLRSGESWERSGTAGRLRKEEDDEEESFIHDTTGPAPVAEENKVLPLIPTAQMALKFCLLWFLANYFAMACLQYTTVASTTILTSTSSMWTLLIGAITKTEKFTWRKLGGVLLSLTGVALISQVDLGARDTDNGDKGSTFPNKPPLELALGDAFALLSAVIYGLYTITLKRTTLSAQPREIHMPTFFGFVGLFNVLFLWPAFLGFHFTGLETFQPPPTGRVWTILLINSVSSLFSDICWAYAMVFTSPLIVTVGLSLTIPLSLVGEMIIQGRFESWIYWLGAFIVVGSFVFVERAGRDDQQPAIMPVDEESDGEPGPAIVVDRRAEPAGGRVSTERSRLMADARPEGGGHIDDIVDRRLPG